MNVDKIILLTAVLFGVGAGMFGLGLILEIFGVYTPFHSMQPTLEGKYYGLFLPVLMTVAGFGMAIRFAFWWPRKSAS